MGLGGIQRICENLISHGRAPSTPVAIVSKGTTPDQKVLIGTLETMPELVSANEIARPTLTIVGEVVALHDRLLGIAR